ncbi:F0F1 ATP synthase subunit delta [Fusibacter tunisiensis]|uniref:ATP synthase subunit delta n=1 Tax=Fusibacter tunisiensis TaxID=1008308 RepID=A0ABS2MPH3_9FIRM|nr:F0F1 ATP synthase subunit delta [Fusibacter tunisiensis]MBM7561301.1 F-type H+-transporting ATPase subunit delta [Fusibacter tunisiensis]
MAELVSSRYSSAIFEYALEENRLEQIQKEFDALANALIENPDYFQLLITPEISVDEKKALVKKTFGDTFSNEMMNFIQIVIDKKRTSELLDVKKEFDKLVDAHNNLIHATVESVVPLTEDQIESLRKNLEKITGKNIQVTLEIKPELLGGMTVKMGDHIIDGSVKYKLEGMLNGLTQIII